MASVPPRTVDDPAQRAQDVLLNLGGCGASNSRLCMQDHVQAIGQGAPVPAHGLPQCPFGPISDDCVPHPAGYGQADSGRPDRTGLQGEHSQQAAASPDSSIIDRPELGTRPKPASLWERTRTGRAGTAQAATRR